jgi:tetratricopeptide (TPR) repeat protein
VIPDTGQDQWFDQRLAADQWADPLLLLMAAVVAASDGIPAALKLSRPDLAKTLASRELDRVRKSVEDRSAKDLLVHLYGCITLCGGLSRDDAGNIAEGEFAALRKQYPGGPGQAVDDLARLLGARDWLSALTPDLLGEALLLAAFDGVLGGAVTTRVAPIAPVQVAATLIRSAQDFAHYGEARPLEWLQALVAKGQQGPDLLSAIQEALPGDTLVLRQLGLDVTDSLVRSLAQTPEPHSTGVQTTLSRLWNNLSNRQSDMGMRTEALASIAQAVRIRQELAEANSDVFLPDLATAMNNLALRQSGLGQRKEALASISAVVRYYRALVAANQNTFLSDLARSLHNLAINQTDMGLHNEALASISEAVHIRRALATADPDAFLPNLARSLNNMGSIQSDIGQRYQALGSLGEAVRYYRVLAKAKPDAFLPDLATALNNLALRQSDMGQGVEGLASVTEAVRYYRALAKANPSAFFPELARSLNTLATLQSQMGMRMEALASIDEAVSIRRVLANTNPDAFGPDLARSIIVLVTCLAAMGKMLEARDAAAECLRLLAPFCLKYFETFGDLARAVVNDYVIRSEQLGLEPDWELLRSYMPFFKSAGSNG